MNTTSAAFFEAKYQAVPDPWDFAHDAYELARYDAIVEALQGQRYARAFEPGCSVGVLTERLAATCDAVDACDFSATAAAQARARCAALPNVHVCTAALTGREDWKRYDLVVLSEIGYYFTDADWLEMVDTMVGRMQHGTTLLAAHWLGHSDDHILSGDCVHAILETNKRLVPVDAQRLGEGEQGFRLNLWRRA